MKTWFKYIVEAAVILFSILAAFWLDDWGEDKREIEKKVVVLNNLLIELERNDDVYSFTEINLEERSRQFRYLYNSWGKWEMDSLKNKDDGNQRRLSLRTLLFRTDIGQLKSNSYKSAIQDGTISLIEDNRIRERLSDIHEALQLIMKEERDNEINISNNIMSHVGDNYGDLFLSSRLERDSSFKFFPRNEMDSISTAIFFDRIKNDGELKLMFWYKLEKVEGRKNYIKYYIRRSIKRTIEDIKSELANH